MYISKKDRSFIKNKFLGKCAYSGTDLKEDWEVEHIEPVVRNWWNNTAVAEQNHYIDNMIPVQKLINHYKGSLSLELFRSWYLKGLHLRLKKLPKNPTVPKTIKRKAYLLAIAAYFDITPEKPFNGVFYFETLVYSGKTKNISLPKSANTKG